MFTKEIKKMGATILQSDDLVTLFALNAKLFVIGLYLNGFEIYDAYQKGDSYKTLPGGVFGTNFGTIRDFVTARA